MIPSELFRGQRITALAFVVAFVAGMNFFSLLNFWPLTISHVWDADTVKVGLRGFAPVFSGILGAIFWSAMLSVWRGGAKWVLALAASILTVFGGGPGRNDASQCCNVSSLRYNR